MTVVAFEYISFTKGSVIHLRDASDQTLCGRVCEGFDNSLDAGLWARSPELHCKVCETRALQREQKP